MFLPIALLRALVALIQWLPLRTGARLGRFGGALAWWVDRRHRRVALTNLAQALPELSKEQRLAIARENLRRIGENYVCALKTACMSPADLAKHVEWVNIVESLPTDGRSIIGAVGHFGNFELFASASAVAPGWRWATTYRALPDPRLNGLLQSVRNRSGIRFFERRSEARRLREFLREGRAMLGLLSDQHAGDRGLWLPFLGHDCSCSAAPALFAARYRAPLCVGICFRTALARWRVEVVAMISTTEPDGTRRSAEAITSDINRHFEAAIRRDPANWVWVHRRWKPISRWQAQVAAGEAPSGESGEEEGT